MEYRRRSLWNRVWENDSLDSLSEENYIRDVYQERNGLPWREVCHGAFMSLWKGVQWLFRGSDSYKKIEERWIREEEEEEDQTHF